jgi:hypothetical protein
MCSLFWLTEFSVPRKWNIGHTDFDELGTELSLCWKEDDREIQGRRGYKPVWLDEK